MIAGQFHVATICNSKNNPHTDADARLIAAAPELLEALKRAVDHLIMSGIKQDDAPEALAQARAALAQAISV